ncbi:MAG: DUF3365 domain-containing protein [Deltaproteobacteria bacterium]|nr:DUF3365 domain-containing protein [Deltaproteobacteria bacterium]
MCLALAACGSETAPPTAPPTDVSAEEASAEEAVAAVGEAPAEEASAKEADEATLREAKGAAKQLGTVLKERLLTVVKEEGASAAMEVCSSEAQERTAEVAAEKGIHVGRASLRLRNPENTAPPWVQEWLEAQGERKAEGLDPFVRVDDTDAGRRARVLMPIGVEEDCLLCHGPHETLAPDVRETLAQRYPTDQATGYAVGDLRGALWAEAEVVALTPKAP